MSEKTTQEQSVPKSSPGPSRAPATRDSKKRKLSAEGKKKVYSPQEVIELMRCPTSSSSATISAQESAALEPSPGPSGVSRTPIHSLSKGTPRQKPKKTKLSGEGEKKYFQSKRQSNFSKIPIGKTIWKKMMILISPCQRMKTMKPVMFML